MSDGALQHLDQSKCVHGRPEPAAQNLDAPRKRLKQDEQEKPDFWFLVRLLESEGVSLPLLRAFVELGRAEAQTEFPKKNKLLRNRIAEFLRRQRAVRRAQDEHAIRRKHVWQSKVMSPRLPGTRWTLKDDLVDGERKLIGQLLKSGLSVRQTCARLGISKATLYRRAPKVTRMMRKKGVRVPAESNLPVRE